MIDRVSVLLEKTISCRCNCRAPGVGGSVRDAEEISTMSNHSLQIFAPLFEQRLALLNNPTCQSCNANPKFKHPLIPWILGSDFHKTRERIIFVGKPHRGIPGKIRESGIIDPTEGIFSPGGLWDFHWPYWSYTREIVESIYGSNAAKSICLSNLIKCTNTCGSDATTREMAVGCVKDLGVVWREIEAIKARTVVFYTYGLYRDLLRDVPCALPGSVHEITSYDYSVPVRNKMLGWWERSCDTVWWRNLRLLVVGHPERMGRSEYVRLLSSWLKK